MFSAILWLAGCNKEEGEEGGTFTPPSQGQLTQKAFADNESTGNGFSFSTEAPWSATINEVPVSEQTDGQAKSTALTPTKQGNQVVWLKLYNGDNEAYSGEAGNITLHIEIEQNYTGERRMATITITSGNNSFTITVIQEGTKQDGTTNEPPVKVTQITLNKTELNLDAGEKATLYATVEPENATIKSVTWTSSNPEIVSVNPVSGEITAIAEGSATITATSSSNKEVSASCIVTVGDNMAPEYVFVAQIDRTLNYWDKLPMEERYEWAANYTFNYDQQNRVSSYTINFNATDDSNEKNQLTCWLDYSSKDLIKIKEQWTNEGTEEYEIKLNEQGYISQGKSYPSYENSGLQTYNIEYNDENRIARISYAQHWMTYTYMNGVLSGGTYFDGYETSEDYGLEQMFNQESNNRMNLDINLLFIPDLLLDGPSDVERADVPGRLGRLALMRLAGQGMDRYLTQYLAGWDEREDAEIGFNSWPEPNVIIHQSYEYFTTEGDDLLHYEYNEDGSVASVTTEETCIKMKHEYDIVVGNELVVPGNPGSGYKYEIKNKKDTELDRGKNAIVYTFTYR